MEQLIDALRQYRNKLPESRSEAISESILEKLCNIYPFNKFEYMISHLIADGVLTLDAYHELRADYVDRNKYLYLFELAPRTFGQEWGERHLVELVPELRRPRKSIDPDFAGEYDLWLDGIKIEVKASRVVRKIAGDSLAEKAMSFGMTEDFDMNFQQLKPGCCDVFVWIAVWRDRIDYWILSAGDVRNHPGFSNQHRASRISDTGEVQEGQIHINRGNYDDFDKYKVTVSQIKEKILTVGKL